MTLNLESAPQDRVAADRYQTLADEVLSGNPIGRDDALSILQAPDGEVLSILAAGYRIRHRYFGNSVQLYFLMNAKSGLCPEDCHYCSQSKISSAPVPKYNILRRDELMEERAWRRNEVRKHIAW